MTRTRFGVLLAASLIAALVGSLPALAEEVEKKFRISLSYGQYNNRDVVPSDAANIMSIVNDRGEFETFIEDPRNDNAALGQLQIRKTDRITVTGQYAVNRFFLVEGSAGYAKGDVSDVEMQAQYDGMVIDPVQRYDYSIYNFDAGKIDLIPFQFSAIARFRPKAAFNPYLGIGFGYTIVDFTPSDSLNDVSQVMDGLRGGQAAVLPYPSVAPNYPTTYVDMTGARVEAGNYLEWHAIGGFEYTIKRKWAVYADLRYESANRNFFLGFNGSDSLGISVPARQSVVGSPEVSAIYGPWYIPSSGLVDGGRFVNPESYTTGGVVTAAPPGVCNIPDPRQCVFLLNRDMSEYNTDNAGAPDFVPVTPDGQADPGLYYVKGGTVKYGGTTLQIGIRYTF